MSEKIEAELHEIFAELGITKAESAAGPEGALIASPDLDSLTLMDLCVALEERYDFIIEPADVMKQETIGNLARFIAARRPERA